MNKRKAIREAINKVKYVQTFFESPELVNAVSALQVEVKKYPPQQQAAPTGGNDQSAADDYLDYLHNQW